MLLGLVSWFVIPNPFATRAPCVVAYQDASEIRSETSGFVKEVCVHDGARVEAGTLLMRLGNLELESRVRELTAELKKEETLERIAMDRRNPADAQIAAQNQVAITEKLSERSAELAALDVRAPVAGRVVARNLHHWPGQFVTRGDQLLTIGSDSQKEIRVSVASEDVDSTDELLGQPISIEIGSHRSVLGTVRRVTPRASSRITHESLIAPHGGPIPVKENSSDRKNEDPYMFCEARFHVVAELPVDSANRFYAGENGFANLESNSDTLGKFIVNSLTRWIREQLSIVDSA